MYCAPFLQSTGKSGKSGLSKVGWVWTIIMWLKPLFVRTLKNVKSGFRKWLEDLPWAHRRDTWQPCQPSSRVTKKGSFLNLILSSAYNSSRFIFPLLFFPWRFGLFPWEIWARDWVIDFCLLSYSALDAHELFSSAVRIEVTMYTI
jgi:hypothetical protein